LALTDALGNLVRFVLLPGNRYDTVGVAPLIHGLSFDALLADKAFDSNWIIEEVNTRGATICISQRPQRKEPLVIDEEMYKWRHLVENFFCDLKRRPSDCAAHRQNRPQLRRHDQRMRRPAELNVNLNRP
jgi:transposase